MKEKFLPIGSIVTLNGATKKIMITGYLPQGKNNEVFDYSACTYPEGVISSDRALVFNHSQINEINFEGLQSNEHIEFTNKIKNLANNINELQKNKFNQNIQQTKAQNQISNQSALNKTYKINDTMEF